MNLLNVGQDVTQFRSGHQTISTDEAGNILFLFFIDKKQVK